MNLYYLPDFIGWKVIKTGNSLISFGAGMIESTSCVLATTTEHQALPKWFKMEVDEKFDQFYPYLEKNWERSASKVSTKEEWMELP